MVFALMVKHLFLHTVSGEIYCCYKLLAGLAKPTMNKLQFVQNFVHAVSGLKPED